MFAFSSPVKHAVKFGQHILARGTLVDKRKVCSRKPTRAKCFYCGHQMTLCRGYKNTVTTDHIHPVCRGGLQEIENNVQCCLRCNQDKAHLTLEEYRLIIAYRNHQLIESDFRFYGEHHPEQCSPLMRDGKIIESEHFGGSEGN